MTEIKCPKCGSAYTIPDYTFHDTMLTIKNWYCERCFESSPVSAWSQRGTGVPEVTEPESTTEAKPDMRTVEEKQRDERDDNLRGMFGL